MDSKIKLSNWNERTPEFWRKIGNTAIYSLPLLSGAVMASPLSPDVRQWVCFGLTLLLVGAKGFSKFFKEDSIAE